MTITGKDGKVYKTVAECEKADKEFDALIEKEKAEKEAAQKVRQTKAKEIEVAYDEAVNAVKHYCDLLSKFTDEYGGYHTTIKSWDPFDGLFNLLFKCI